MEFLLYKRQTTATFFTVPRVAVIHRFDCNTRVDEIKYIFALIEKEMKFCLKVRYISLRQTKGRDPFEGRKILKKVSNFETKIFLS